MSLRNQLRIDRLVDHPLIRQDVGFQFFILAHFLLLVKSQRFFDAVDVVVGSEVNGFGDVEPVGEATVVSLSSSTFTLRKVKT